LIAQDASILRTILNRRNVALLRDWTDLEASLSGLQVPVLLEPYRDNLISYCRHFQSDTKANLSLLALLNDSILEDLLSKTQVATQYLRIMSSRLATPVLRSSPKDVLCLKILTWIHQAHVETASIPVAFASGEVAILPMMRALPVYLFPSLEQNGLLFQSLHFHEFGHGLYVLHKPEMDDLIKELQENISDILTPLSQRNDRHAEEAAKERQAVVGRWYDWAQEIFCDAVGLLIGGPAYLYAFSGYCSNLSRSDLYLPAEDLARTKHPVTWLRIRLLVRRAEKLGLSAAASQVRQEWAALAGVMQVSEDYHGYYEDAMEEEVYRVISDMLAEANPRHFLPEEVDLNPAGEVQPGVQTMDNPVSLLNRAWHMHNLRPDLYAEWEREAIKVFTK